jgi:hypothetical protein
MGQFVYDSGTTITIDDRTLAHLQVVIFDKLRRNESFALDLHDDRHVRTMWISQRSPLAFHYSGNRRPALNHQWLELMSGEASLIGVLRVLPEPPEPARVPAPMPGEAPAPTKV